MAVRKRGSISKFLSVFISVVLSVFMLLPQGAVAQTEAVAVTAPTETVTAVEDPAQTLPDKGNITVNFKNVEIKTVLHYLSEVSGVDIIPSPGVEASVTMRLRNKPWETALDIVTRNYGYVYSKEDGIIRVIPKGQLAVEETVTEVIPLNNFIQEIEFTKGEDDSDEIIIEEKKESIEQLMRAINSMLNSARGEGATYVKSVNSIVITAIPSKIDDIKKMIKAIDKKTAQVIMDVKVVEIQLTKDERFGVDWNAIMSAAGPRRPITFPFTNDGILDFLPGKQARYYPTNTLGDDEADFYPTNTAAPATTVTNAVQQQYFFSYGTIDMSTFTATLSLLQNRGDTEILSAPRITTLDNQKAYIKVIEKIMLQKSVQSTDTATLVTVEFEDEEDAREVGIKLTVIPHVNEHGDISINLLPEVSNNEGFNTVQVGVQQSTTVALTFTSREANTVLRVRDGDTIFLGGLIRKDIEKTDNKLPVLGDLFGGIPLLGNLVRYEADNVTRTEIVFFVTVHLVKESMDSIDRMKLQKEYDKYILEKKEEKKKEPDLAERIGNWLGFGRVKETKETVEVPVVLPKEAEEEKKPLLDFRNKKEE